MAPPCWEPGTQYNLGDVVQFEGHRYKIIQPHRSQGDWTPPVTPALWGRLPGGVEDHGRQQGEQCAPPPQSEQRPWDDHKAPYAEVPTEVQKKHWYDLDGDQKKKLEIGGGLAVGAALLAGGFAAYRHHEKSEEEKKANVWGLQRWVTESQQRTEEFRRSGPRGPTTWVLAHGKNIPQGAIVGGNVNGQTVFIARAFCEGGLQVGYAGPQTEKGAVIGYAHDQIDVDTYEVLIGDSREVRWVDAKGHFKPENAGFNLVEGGREANGTELFIAQAEHNACLYPGKAGKHLSGAFVVIGGKEKEKTEYKVLAYV